jgi:hypothetical protein
MVASTSFDVTINKLMNKICHLASVQNKRGMSQTVERSQQTLSAAAHDVYGKRMRHIHPAYASTLLL